MDLTLMKISQFEISYGIIIKVHFVLQIIINIVIS